MANCPRCHEPLREPYEYSKKSHYRFCPHCGWQLDSDARRTDFELGKIEALNTIKEELLKWFLRITVPFTIIALIFGPITITSYIKNAVNDKVDKEIAKISEHLVNIRKIFPLIEHDFYRIKKFDVGLSIVDTDGREIQSTEEEGELVPKNAHGLVFRTGKHNFFRISYIYSLVDETDKKIDTEGKSVDNLSKYNLNLNPDIEATTSGEPFESKNSLLNFIKGIFVIIKINDITLDKILIKKDEIKIENVGDEPTYQHKKLTIQIQLKKYLNDAEEIRKRYREKRLLAMFEASTSH